ncbi:MAG TPA: ABC transporter substrate-binding protein [Burkholderiaceae bacterium]|nr:ABC transporter substrate-binding protein [Burkholderiaceae bacterium]
MDHSGQHYDRKSRRWLGAAGRALGCAALAISLLSSAAQAENGVSSDEIVLGQSTPLSGPLAELGQDSSLAAKAYFDYVNLQGGVNGRKIRLLTLDDGYNTDRVLENARTLIEKDRVFALFNVFGTPGNSALLPVIAHAGVPNIAPYTGSEAVRKPLNPLVFNIRAGYADETEAIINHLGVRGISKIAVVYQNNAFGKDGLDSIGHALARRQLKIHASAAIENDASDAGRAAAMLAQSAPKAILMVTAGKPSAAFIKAYDKLAPGMQFFALSVMGSAASVDALGKEGVGVVVSQVMPFPFSATSDIVHEYQQVMRKMGLKIWSFASIEGFVSAKVTVEGLKHAGRDLSRDKFMAALEALGKVNYGGYMVNFSKSNHQGSSYVELTVITKNGRFMR